MSRSAYGTGEQGLEEWRYDIFVHASGDEQLDAETLDSLLGQSDVVLLRIYYVVDNQNGLLDAPWRRQIRQVDIRNLDAFVAAGPSTIVAAIPGGVRLRPGALATINEYFVQDALMAMVTAPVGSPREFTSSQTWAEIPSSSPMSVSFTLDQIRETVKRPRQDLLLFAKTAPACRATGGLVGEFYFERARRRKRVVARVPTENEYPRDFDPAHAFAQRPSRTHRQTWLFSERVGLLAEEGAWQLFEYVHETRPDVESFFVADPGIAMVPRADLPIIYKGTAEWRTLIANADVSFVTDSARDYLLRTKDHLDSAGTKHVYLTHGGLGYRPGSYQGNHQYFDLVCCDSKHGGRSAAAAWKFGASRFAPTGLAKWDRLRPGFHRPLVLFSPTWRRWYDENERGQFIESIRSIACAPALREVLASNGLELVLNLHFREAEFQRELVTALNDEVTFVTPDSVGPYGLRSVLEDCAAVITDYSSVFWDATYRGQEAYLYQFDLRNFLVEQEQSSFDLPASTRWLNISYTFDELVEQLSAGSLREFRQSESRVEAWNEIIARPPEGHREAICREVELRFGSTPKRAPRRDEPSIAANRFLELDTFDRIGLVGRLPSSIDFAGSSTVLSPDDLADGGVLDDLDALLVVPALFGDGPWADAFFDQAALADLLLMLAPICSKRKLPLFVYRNSTYALEKSVDWPCHAAIEYLFDQRFDIAGEHGSEAVLVSVIVPTYNRSVQLVETVESVLAQRGNFSLEVIVVDDGSTDDTKKRARHLSARDSRVRYIYQPNQRQGAARNTGIMMAFGQFVMFLDAGDLLHPEFVAECLALEGSEDADVMQGLVVSHRHGSDRFTANQNGRHRFLGPSAYDIYSWPVLACDPFVVASLMRRNFLLERSLFFCEAFQEDEFFASRLSLSGARYLSSKRSVYYYVDRGGASDTRVFSTDKLVEILRVGLHLARSYRSSRLPRETVDLKIGVMVARFDRYIFRSELGYGTRAFQGLVLSLLQDILSFADSHTIKRNARHCPNLLLGIKLLGTGFEPGDEKDAKAHLVVAGITDPGEYDHWAESFRVSSTFDPYTQSLVKFVARSDGTVARSDGTTDT